MSMRTRTNWGTNIFYQVGIDRSKKVVAYCHKDEYKEAVAVIANLYTLMKHKFGPGVKRWFTHEAILHAQSKHFDGSRIKNTEDDELLAILPDRYFKMSPANVRAAIIKGTREEDLAVFDEDEDDMSISDGEEDEDEQMKVIIEFDPDLMFRPEPAIAGAHGQDSPTTHSFLTGATSGIVAQSEDGNRSRGSETTIDSKDDSSQRQTGLNQGDG
jgi:hypothetical protein